MMQLGNTTQYIPLLCKKKQQIGLLYNWRDNSMYVVTSLAGESTNRQGKWMGALVFFQGTKAAVAIVMEHLSQLICDASRRSWRSDRRCGRRAAAATQQEGYFLLPLQLPLFVIQLQSCKPVFNIYIHIHKTVLSFS